ncbi:hypothetical protein BLA60_27765 [Actinophytocola xinjiangensis]|uniref:Uncharacterized protein n=1 Tax=Actinophytocola xinjiangensis TaxID=485602 RepID=A0A7Z0WHL8_9PSEU|nr:hypothetical protein [Actinophytocola xinjiangensis]OLF07369.1 hypothetical protein BLA60_27765 [Actinophytocola xinjiangensis]
MSTKLMLEYHALIADLGYPRAAAIVPAMVEASDGFYPRAEDLGPVWYGYPPAMIPYRSNDSGWSYDGLWMHWFVPRSPVFVTTSREDGDLASETCRTEDQLVARTIVDAIVGNDGIDDTISTIATRLGVGTDDLRRFDEHTIQHGDDPDMLGELREFQNEIPRELVLAKDQHDNAAAVYDGQFPLGGPRPHTCLFEYGPDDLTGLDEVPPWLDRESDKQAVFEEHLGAGDLGTAWLALNSTGWTPGQATWALNALMRHAPQNPTFHRVAQTWIDQAQRSGDDPLHTY